MASRLDQRKAARLQESSACYAADSYLLRDRSINPLTELPFGASWRAEREEHGDQKDSLREQLKEMDEHVARLQDMLRCERAKCTRLQLQCDQQEAELRRRELHSNRLKERLSQLTDRPRDKGPSMELLNLLPGSRSKKEQPIKSFRSTAKREEATLRMMLERREAELREAMKLRHSLTTLLHAVRVDMEQTLSDSVTAAQDGDKRLDQTELALGEHVTGGVVGSWRQVQKRLWDVLSEGQAAAAGTDYDKLLAQLQTRLDASERLVRFQQQLLQDSLASSVPCELADSYFLEERACLQARWAELGRQRRTFERERQSFTEAAIRLSRERRDFDLQMASLVKQQYLCDSPLFGKEAPSSSSSRESAALSSRPTSISDCVPVTPSSAESGSAAALGLHQRGAGVQTPSTPELYSALHLPYSCRAVDHQSETQDGRADRIVHTLRAPNLDWSF